MAWEIENPSRDRNKWQVPATIQKKNPFGSKVYAEIEEFIIHEETVAPEDLNILPLNIRILPEEIQAGYTNWQQETINLASSWEDEGFYPRDFRWTVGFYAAPAGWTEQPFYPQAFRWTDGAFYAASDGWSVTEFYPRFLAWTDGAFYAAASGWQVEDFYPMFSAWSDGAFYAVPDGWTLEEFYG